MYQKIIDIDQIFVIVEFDSCVPLNQSRTSIRNSEGVLLRRDTVIIDDTLNVDVDVVFGHDDLAGDLGQLDLNIDLGHLLGHGVDLGQAGVDTLVELAES